MKDSFYTAEQQKVRMRDKKVQSVQEINFDNLVLPMIAVYKNIMEKVEALFRN